MSAGSKSRVAPGETTSREKCVDTLGDYATRGVTREAMAVHSPVVFVRGIHVRHDTSPDAPGPVRARAANMRRRHAT